MFQLFVGSASPTHRPSSRKAQVLKAKGSALPGFFGGVSKAGLFEALLHLWVPEFLLTKRPSEGYGNLLTIGGLQHGLTVLN